MPLVWLLLAPLAHAVDLDEWLPLGPVSYTGAGDGDDVATDVVVDQTGHVIAVGAVDGAPGHDTNGYLVALEFYDLRFLWDLEFDAGAEGVDVPDSNDRIEAIANPGSNDLAFCGRSASPDLGGDPLGAYWVVSTIPDEYGIHYVPTVGWSWTRSDGDASPDQSCMDMDRAGMRLYAAGYSEQEGTGRWVSYRVGASNGTGDPVYTYADADPAPNEKAHAISGGRVDGAFAVAGAIGDGSGSLSWHVRFHDAKGTLSWTDTYGSVAGDAVALGAAYDEANGTVTVAGYEVTDSKAPERDWLVIQYDAAGDGLGGPTVNWVTRIGTGSGSDDTATAVEVDADGNIVVAGGQTPATTEVWALEKLSGTDGTVLQSWQGPTHKGDSRILGLHFRDSLTPPSASAKLAFAGYTHDGTKREFTVDAIEPDTDGDGTPDSPDECPDDPDKIETGICGCGVSDAIDTDGDETPDCVDRCPEDPTKDSREGPCGCGNPDVDSDGDAVLDCFDGCPADGDKLEPGACGCGVTDEDVDQDDILDCFDDCPRSPAGEVVGTDGCPEPDPSEGCGCHVGPSGLGPLLPLLAMFAGVQWRRNRNR